MVASLIMAGTWFEGIYLEDHQRDLLARMMEGERSVPPNQRGSSSLAAMGVLLACFTARRDVRAGQYVQ